MKKVILSLVMVAAMSVSFVSCKEQAAEEPAVENVEEATEDAIEVIEEAAEEVEEATEEVIEETAE